MIGGLATLLEFCKQRWISYPNLQSQANAVSIFQFRTSITKMTKYPSKAKTNPDHSSTNYNQWGRFRAVQWRQRNQIFSTLSNQIYFQLPIWSDPHTSHDHQSATGIQSRSNKKINKQTKTCGRLTAVQGLPVGTYTDVPKLDLLRPANDPTKSTKSDNASRYQYTAHTSPAIEGVCCKS